MQPIQVVDMLKEAMGNRSYGRGADPYCGGVDFEDEWWVCALAWLSLASLGPFARGPALLLLAFHALVLSDHCPAPHTQGGWQKGAWQAVLQSCEQLPCCHASLHAPRHCRVGV